MKTENEKLREMMINFSLTDDRGGAESGGGEHLRDEDFIRLIESGGVSRTAESLKINSQTSVSNANSGELSTLRNHLIKCDSCLAQFKDFYAFFAPPEPGEMVAGKDEIAAAWQEFPLPATQKKQKPGFWSRLFSAERKPNYFSALGWGLAAVLMILTGISFFALRQATNEKNQLVEQLENQKQTSEERLKTIEQTGQNSELAEREKTRLEEEKAELQKRIAALQNEIEIAKQQKQPTVDTTPPKNTGNAPSIDNSLVAVNTPIYDVFPADSTVRGNGGQSQNRLAVPNGARNVVLILNAAGRADFPVYQAELTNNSGKVIWRGGGLRKDSTGNFTLTLSGVILKAGNYRLKLSGKPGGGGGGSPETVAEYTMIIATK